MAKRGKKLDEEMLQAEMDKILTEVTEDCDTAENVLIVVTIAQVSSAPLLRMLTTEGKRKVFEILYRYYALIEGLQKE